MLISKYRSDKIHLKVISEEVCTACILREVVPSVQPAKEKGWEFPKGAGDVWMVKGGVARGPKVACRSNKMENEGRKRRRSKTMDSFGSQRGSL